MLIIYRKSDGMIVSNSGTNSLLPEGPSFDSEVKNAIEIYGGSPEDYGEFRLHDTEQMTVVRKCLTHNCTLEFDTEGKPADINFGDPLPTPGPESQLPTQDERIEALELAMLDIVLGGM